MDAAPALHRHAPAPVGPGLSLFLASSRQRVLAVGSLIALLWLLVWWALD